MDSSSSRTASMKPVILKAGVALIVSATGLIFTRFMARRENNDQVTSSASNPETSLSCRGDDDGEEEEEDSETRNGDNEKEILRLKDRFEELKNKEYEMETRFLRYCDLKDKESMLVELKSMLALEKAHLDFFGREVSTMEEENKRIQDCVIVYLKLVEKIQFLKSENSLLQSKAKKLTRRTKELSSVMKAKNARIYFLERTLLRNLKDLETEKKRETEMEDEITDLKAAISESSNMKSEMKSEEDYETLLEQYKNLKRVREDEAKEMIKMRWSNACLKHAVMRYGLSEQENESRLDEITFAGNGNFHAHMSLEDQMALEAAEEHHDEEHRQHHESSRRKRLMKRLKRMLEWHEKGNAKSEERCFGRHSLTVEPDEEHSIVLARRSCSSV